jgi:hypothetical protein
MRIIPLSLEHCSLLAGLWKPLCMEHNLQFAEYSFANNYLFRRKHKYEVFINGLVLLRGVNQEGTPYFIPTSLVTPSYISSIEGVSKQPFSLFPIPDACMQNLQSYSSTSPPTFSLSESDYLFKKEKFITLEGLSSRRNLIHQLHKQHVVKSKMLTEREIPEALDILETWQQQSGQDREATDYWPCRDALEAIKTLDLFGRIVYADGKPVGIALGELLTPKIALLHICKSFHTLHGVTPFLYQDFAQHLPETVEWINLEQDLGIPALRQGKAAYHPDLLLNKWWIHIGLVN